MFEPRHCGLTPDAHLPMPDGTGGAGMRRGGRSHSATLRGCYAIPLRCTSPFPFPPSPVPRRGPSAGTFGGDAPRSQGVGLPVRENLCIELVLI